MYSQHVACTFTVNNLRLLEELVASFHHIGHAIEASHALITITFVLHLQSLARAKVLSSFDMLHIHQCTLLCEV